MQNAVEMPAQLQTQQPEEQQQPKEPSNGQDATARSNGHNEGSAAEAKENGGNEAVTEPEGDTSAQSHGNAEVIKQQMRQNATASLLANHKSEQADQQFNDKYQPSQMTAGAPQVNPMAPADFYRNGDFGGPQQFEQIQQHQYPDQQQDINSITYGQPPPHHMQQVGQNIRNSNSIKHF